MSTQTMGWEPMTKVRAAQWLAAIGALLVASALLGSVGLIFALLIGLMLTGMPISIALGLTVLTFLFTMTKVPVESVALKLFTGIERFEIMAIPFFILAGNFLTHGGVARRMINFATSIVGHWCGRNGAGGDRGSGAFFGGLGFQSGDRCGNRFNHASRDA